MFNFSQYFSNYEQCYQVITWLTCIGLLIVSFEYLAIHKEFKPNGVYSWKVFRSRHNFINNKLFHKFDFLFGYTAFIVSQLLIIGCCVMLPFAQDHLFKAILIAIICLISLMISFRNIVGADGSDQLFSIILLTLFISYLINDPFIYKVGLIFIAAQVILSYVVAGIAKGISQKWRSGQAITMIMNTKTYGHEKIATMLSSSSRAFNIFLCWNIIVVECLFFAVIFLPYPWFIPFLIWGFLFHLYNAVVMGLNNFFWAFLAAYPSIFYLNHLITR